METKLTVPISAKDTADAVSQIRSAVTGGAEMLELRLDYFENLTAEIVAELVNKAEQRYEVEKQREEYRLMYNREKSKRRKALLRGNVLVQIKPSAIRSRYAEFDNCCAYCGKQHKAMDLEIEHFVPISKGGTHVLSNIVPACKPCNSSKTYHDAKAWYEKQEFYSRKRWLKIIDVLGKRKMHAGQLSFV